MNLNEKIKIFPNDIIFNYSNHQILRDMSTENLSEIKKPLYVFFNNFDILEFSYNKFKSTGIITARHSPKQNKYEKYRKLLSSKLSNDSYQWSFYYDSYVKGNELDFYHDNMKRIKRKIKNYIDDFYDPFHEVDVNMTIIKTVKDLLDYNNLKYTFVKPTFRPWWEHASSNEFMDTASEELNNYINNHDLSYLLKENFWITKLDFIRKYRKDYEKYKSENILMKDTYA